MPLRCVPATLNGFSHLPAEWRYPRFDLKDGITILLTHRFESVRGAEGLRTTGVVAPIPQSPDVV
jgi:hypothetical protein